MEKQGWKITAIVSTILLILVLMGLGYVFFVGAVEEYKEDVCINDICGLVYGEHDAYFYSPDGDCYCFAEGELNFIRNVDQYLEYGRS